MGYRVQIKILNYTEKSKELSRKIAEVIRTFSGHYPQIQISNRKRNQ